MQTPACLTGAMQAACATERTSE